MQPTMTQMVFIPVRWHQTSKPLKIKVCWRLLDNLSGEGKFELKLWKTRPWDKLKGQSGWLDHWSSFVILFLMTPNFEKWRFRKNLRSFFWERTIIHKRKVINQKTRKIQESSVIESNGTYSPEIRIALYWMTLHLKISKRWNFFPLFCHFLLPRKISDNKL